MNKVIKPVYQYDLYGNFIKEFNSITEAGLFIKVSAPTGISSVCQKKYTTAYGFQWRYKSKIHDKNLNIGLGKHNLDEDMVYLKGLWYSICRRPFNPNDERYEPNIQVDNYWKESFDNFYFDIIEEYKLFLLENPAYKKEIKNRHSYFSRINKNKGWIKENTEFMTPDFSMRHRDNVHKVIKDKRTLTAEMIVEELRSKGIYVQVGTILKRMRENRNLTAPSQQSKYKYKGIYYSLVELAEMLDFDYDYVKHRINKFGENLNEGIESYSNFKSALVNQS